LERIRADYEQHRQPETLREASGYLNQLTSGKYTRIWTPLAHDILFVDTKEGQSLPVQVLSRGTREQLFVSLRLALVAAFGRRGVHLPMILDDVCVNFDIGRTQIATRVLRDFAKQGHQVIYFTCHEHVWRMFQEVKADARRLPNRHGEAIEEKPESSEPIVVPPPADESMTPSLIEEKVADPPPLPLPEPVVAKPLPRAKPKPAAAPAPQEVIEINRIPPATPTPRPPVEVEYWWHTAIGNS
jgi:hypothetical protein